MQKLWGQKEEETEHILKIPWDTIHYYYMKKEADKGFGALDRTVMIIQFEVWCVCV